MASQPPDPSALTNASEEGQDDAPYSSHLASSVDIEAAAFLAWVQVVRNARRDQDVEKEIDADASIASTASNLSSRRADSLEDLTDGLALLDVLSAVDSEHFRNPHGMATMEGSDSLVIRLGSLKRLYRLMME